MPIYKPAQRDLGEKLRSIVVLAQRGANSREYGEPERREFKVIAELASDAVLASDHIAS